MVQIGKEVSRGSFLIILLLVIRYSAAGSLCIDFGDFSPCSCERLSTGKDQFETSIECHQLETANDLFKVARATNGTVDTFSVFASQIGYLPSNLFLRSKVRRIQLYDTPLTHFTEAKESAFLGLDHILEELTMRRCALNQNTKVERLEHLWSLTTLDLSYNQVKWIPKKWFKLPPRRLSQLILKGNGIETIEDGAFVPLTELRLLDLSENDIQSLTISVLPSPASRMEFFYLSYNRLESLPVNFFHNMPILKKLYLDHNRLSVLPSNVFELLWKSNNLISHIDLLGNDLVCDESLCWISFYDNEKVTGSCAEPDLLRGRRIRSIWPWDLNCNETLYKGDTVFAYKVKM